MIELSKDQKEDLVEMMTTAGWKVYQLLLKDLGEEVLQNLRRRIRDREDLIEVSNDEARLEFLEGVIIPLVKDSLGEEEK